jgi:hypothetical protein
MLSLEEKNLSISLFNVVRIGFITEISFASPEGSGRVMVVSDQSQWPLQ